MARLSADKLSPIEKERNTIHDFTEATYTVFRSGEDLFFQIDTYGRSSRKMPEKISQSIQFDRDSAKALYELLGKTFGFNQ